MEFDEFVRANAGNSHSQLNQDLWALWINGNKTSGYFVDIGASDGVDNSNTYLLENAKGWKGIIVEPARIYTERLVERRTVHVCNKAIGGHRETAKFHQTPSAELSCLLGQGDDHLKQYRVGGALYEVEVITLRDLLLEYHAPRFIDYLSIDTEGNELEIINDFDFYEYDIRAITIEHNYTSKREQIFSHLTGYGYNRIFQTISGWDDWYIRR